MNGEFFRVCDGQVKSPKLIWILGYIGGIPLPRFGCSKLMTFLFLLFSSI